MTPEVRSLWERCAAAEVRTLTNMFEVMVRAYARTAGIKADKRAMLAGESDTPVPSIATQKSLKL